MSNIEDVNMEEDDVFLPPDWETLTLAGLREPANEEETRDSTSNEDKEENSNEDRLVIAEDSKDGEVCFMFIV